MLETLKSSWAQLFVGLLQVSVDVPDQKGRLEILKVHARNKKLGEDVDLSEVASRVPGFTGADLANLLNEVRRHYLPVPTIPGICCFMS